MQMQKANNQIQPLNIGAQAMERNDWPPPFHEALLSWNDFFILRGGLHAKLKFCKRTETERSECRGKKW
jgi:hypothetical protein